MSCINYTLLRGKSQEKNLTDARFCGKLNIKFRNDRGEKTARAPRRAWALACHTRMREGSPRHATIAGDRPPRYGEKNAPSYRRARACPSPCNDREGQALALRGLKQSRGTGPRATGPKTLAGGTRSDARLASEGPRATVTETIATRKTDNQQICNFKTSATPICENS